MTPRRSTGILGVVVRPCGKPPVPMKTVSLLLLVPALWLCAGLPARAQDAQTRFRLGQASEQAGDLDRAAQLYLQLHQADPTNIVYFDATQRVLLQLKRYDEAIALITTRLSANPADPALRGRVL